MNPSAPSPAWKRRQFLQRSAISAAGLLGIGCEKERQADWLPWFLRSERPIEEFSSPQGAEIDLISHALNRLTWGAAPGEYDRLARLGPTQEAAFRVFLEEQLHPPPPIERDSSPVARRVLSLESIHQPIGELYDDSPREIHFQLTQAALLRAVYSPYQLYEVMVGFWTDHFNIDFSKSDCRWVKAWDDKHVIRKHALGNFRDLLKASALSPAMLHYLDGKANKKARPEDKPNENYARELLELHTMGVHGGYSQQDVMEVARCLTGWTVNGRDNTKTNFLAMAKHFMTPPGGQSTAGIGRVHFVKRNHDSAAKTVLGHRIASDDGERDLDAVLDILMKHPATGKFLASKLCRRFIADDPPDSAIAATAAAFTSSGGDIRTVLRTLFATPEFLASRGTKFKRPFHFIASALRATAAKSHCGKSCQRALRRMGHLPFDYPTPEGYSDRMQDWTATILARWDFSLKLSTGQLEDTSLRLPELSKAAGGFSRLVAHLYHRRPTAEETEAIGSVDQAKSGEQLALLLASPAFQQF